jgi:hypothetical protein
METTIFINGRISAGYNLNEPLHSNNTQPIDGFINMKNEFTFTGEFIVDRGQAGEIKKGRFSSPTSLTMQIVFRHKLSEPYNVQIFQIAAKQFSIPIVGRNNFHDYIYSSWQGGWSGQGANPDAEKFEGPLVISFLQSLQTVRNWVKNVIP